MSTRRVTTEELRQRLGHDGTAEEPLISALGEGETWMLDEESARRFAGAIGDAKEEKTVSSDFMTDHVEGLLEKIRQLQVDQVKARIALVEMERQREEARGLVAELLDVFDGFRFDRGMRVVHLAERYVRGWRKKPCEDCDGKGEKVLNPSWPEGGEPYSEKCSTCGGSGEEPE